MIFRLMHVYDWVTNTFFSTDVCKCCILTKYNITLFYHLLCCHISKVPRILRLETLIVKCLRNVDAQISSYFLIYKNVPPCLQNDVI
jgi:hypothetical protein